MTAAISLRTIRQELYNQIPGLGLAGVADSLTSSTLTDTYIFADTTVGVNHYRGFYLYRPDATGDDKVKKILQVNTTTGAATIAGTSYSDTVDLDYEMVGLLHPDELNAAIMRAMTRIYFEVLVPLTIVTDGDMDYSDASYWTAASLDTHAKVETAGKVVSGFRALHTADTVGSYTASAEIHVFANTPYYCSATVVADAGTATLYLWDETNNVEIESVSSSGEEGTINLYFTGAIPATCENVKIRLGVGANADLYWNHVVFYPRERKVLAAQSWLDEPFKFLKLREADYTRILGTGYRDATTRTFKDWLQPSMFSLDPLHLDANPYQIQLMRNIPDAELWIHAKRPYSDIENLALDADTTRAPLKQVYAYSKDEIAKILRKRYPNDQRWQVLAQEAMTEIEAETMSRPAIPQQPIKREHDGSI